MDELARMYVLAHARDEGGLREVKVVVNECDFACPRPRFLLIVDTRARRSMDFTSFAE